MKNKAYGFTLIEILVATVILFSSISAVTLLYKSSYLSSEKAQSTIKSSAVIKAILTKVKRSIIEDTTATTNILSGEGKEWGVIYNWEATLLKVGSPPERFSVNSGRIEKYAERYKLWNITLVLNEKKVFEYKELSWF